MKAAWGSYHWSLPDMSWAGSVVAIPEPIDPTAPADIVLFGSYLPIVLSGSYIDTIRLGGEFIDPTIGN